MPQESPEMAPPPIPTADVPDPSAWLAVAVPYAVVKPYSKLALVAALFGFAVPFSVAAVAETALAAPVTTVGRHAAVLNVASDPGVVPLELVAVARK